MALPADSAFASIQLRHPERDVGWLPGGKLGAFAILEVVRVEIEALGLQHAGTGGRLSIRDTGLQPRYAKGVCNREGSSA